MAKATNFRDGPHARIYAHWRQYPAWRALSLASRALLVEIIWNTAPAIMAAGMVLPEGRTSHRRIEGPRSTRAYSTRITRMAQGRARLQIRRAEWPRPLRVDDVCKRHDWRCIRERAEPWMRQYALSKLDAHSKSQKCGPNLLNGFVSLFSGQRRSMALPKQYPAQINMIAITIGAAVIWTNPDDSATRQILTLEQRRPIAPLR